MNGENTGVEAVTKYSKEMETADSFQGLPLCNAAPLLTCNAKYVQFAAGKNGSPLRRDEERSPTISAYISRPSHGPSQVTSAFVHSLYGHDVYSISCVRYSVVR